MIFPNKICTYIADAQQPWEYVWIEFDGLRAKETVELSGLCVNSPVYKAKYKDVAQTMKDEMLYIINHKDDSPFHLIGHLYLFIDSFVKSSAITQISKSNNLRDFYIKEALSFIEQNYTLPITVEDMANRCNLDRSYFGKVFKDMIGQSPQDFLIRYRMSKATSLLTSTSLSIGDISVQVGYPNQLHFSRAFRNIYGMSPRQYRQQNKLLS